MKTTPNGSAKVDPTARHWATRLAAAQTPAQHAAVEWDRTRAAVRDLPEQNQAQAWRDLIGALQAARRQLEGR